MMSENDIRRFWSRVTTTPKSWVECWNWQGYHNSKGYGQISINNKIVMAHRTAYKLVMGEIPTGKQLDHLCRNPPCVNPYHLEPVTGRENLFRGRGICVLNSEKTHCKRGHILAGDNLYARELKKGHRICKICRSELMKPVYVRYKQNKKNREEA